jgi:hypothetical protein
MGAEQTPKRPRRDALHALSERAHNGLPTGSLTRYRIGSKGVGQMAFLGAVFGGLVGGVILGIVTKKPAMGIVGMFIGALVGGIVGTAAT